MKLDTAIVFTKGSFFCISAVALQLGEALAQWANSGEHPSTIQWVIIVSGCVGAGSNAALSFLSGAYADYVKGRANGKATGTTSGDTALWQKAPDKPAESTKV